MKIAVEFIKDFANKKKGDVSTYDGMVASTLIRKNKVAKIYKVKKKTPTK